MAGAASERIFAREGSMPKAAVKANIAKRKTAAKSKGAKAKPRREAKGKRKPARAAGHKFNVSHRDTSTFKHDGLRSYATYRDLGIAEATNGLVVAHVIRMIPPCTADVRKRHYHDVQFQMV